MDIASCGHLDNSGLFPAVIECDGILYPARTEERGESEVLVIDASENVVAPHTARMVQMDNAARWYLNSLLRDTFDQSTHFLSINRSDLAVPRESRFEAEVFNGFEFKYTILPRVLKSDEDDFYPAWC